MRMSLPCFRPAEPQDSLFLPRCEHPVRLFRWGEKRRLLMDIKPSGRLGLIPATALIVFFVGPSQAAIGAEGAAGTARSEAFVAIQKQVKHRSRHWKKNAHFRSDKVALNSIPDNQTNGAKVVDGSRTIPPSVANANAELRSAG